MIRITESEEHVYRVVTPLRGEWVYKYGDSPKDFLSDRELYDYRNDINRAVKSSGVNLAEYIDDDLKNIVTDIRVGLLTRGNSLWVSTKVTTTRDITEDEKDKIVNYLIGQFSDGWGEGFEQQSIDIRPAYGYYDDNDSFESDYDEDNEELHVHFWYYGNDYKSKIEVKKIS